MGTDKWEKAKSQSSSSTKAKPQPKLVSTLFNWNPPKEALTVLKEGSYPLESSVGLLDQQIQVGFRLSVGYNTSKGGYFAIMREESSDWTTARSVSVWAKSLPNVLRLLAYYLAEVNPEFPEGLSDKAMDLEF